MDRSHRYSIRVGDEEFLLLKEEADRIGGRVSDVIRLALQSYFQGKADMDCKLQGINAWREH